MNQTRDTMEELSDKQLRERRDRALEKLKEFRQRKLARERMIQHVRMLEDYLKNNRADEGDDVNKEIEDARVNSQIIEEIARCEQLTGRQTSMIRDLQVCDHRTGKEIAKLTIAAAVQWSNDKETPLRAVMDFKNGQMLTAASIIVSDDTTVTRNSPTETESIGVQVDVPFPVLYGNRDDKVYQRNKFRPETIDKYGNEKSFGDSACEDIIETIVPRRHNLEITCDEKLSGSQYENISSDESVTESVITLKRCSSEKDSMTATLHTTERKAARIARKKNREIWKYEEKEKRAKKIIARQTTKATRDNSGSIINNDPELTGRMRPTQGEASNIILGGIERASHPGSSTVTAREEERSVVETPAIQRPESDASSDEASCARTGQN